MNMLMKRKIASMPARSLTIMLFATFFLASGLRAQTPVSAAALQGAWKLKSMTMSGKSTPATGYMLFAGDHYSFITNTERPKMSRETSSKPFAQMTEQEKEMQVESMRSMTASAGSFTIVGDEIHYYQEVTRLPHLVGETEKRKSWMDSGRLIQDFAGGGGRRVMEWEKDPAKTGDEAR